MITSPTRPGSIFASAIRKITGSSLCPGAVRVQLTANEHLGTVGVVGNLNETVSSNPTKVFPP